MRIKSSSHNFGFGKSLAFSVKQALDARFGGGHFSSVHSHLSRSNVFISFLNHINIRDWRAVDQAAFDTFSYEVRDLVEENIYSISYGQNLLSTVNVVLQSLRGDKKVKVSPRAFAGPRSHVRQSVPGGLDLGDVMHCAQDLVAANLPRAAVIVLLARHVGVRMREALLADLPRWLREAEALGAVNVQEGTKGGRDAPRWVPVAGNALSMIRDALVLLVKGSRNLLRHDEQLIEVIRGECRRARPILKRYGVKGYHDLRAAFACDRYQMLTGHPAPVICGEVRDRELDAAARLKIAQELGHGRPDVSGNYVGGRR